MANPGRHRNKAVYRKAEVNQVTILEAPGSPENGKAKTGPKTPQSGTIHMILEDPKAAEENKAQIAENQENAGERVSPCRCNRPETCTGEATSTTAGDSGNDSDNQE